MNKKDEKNTFYTRFGLRLLQVLLIIYALLLIKRSVDIYHDNKRTNKPITREYFDKSHASGLNKAHDSTENRNPLRELCL